MHIAHSASVSDCSLSQTLMTSKPISLSASPFEHSSISEESTDLESPPLYWRILSHLVRPITTAFNWLSDRILLRETEMEEAETLIENGLVGFAWMCYDRPKGEERLRGVLRGIDHLYHKVAGKWFPYAEVNRFMRHKLIVYKLMTHTLLGETSEVERCRQLLLGMGLPLPKRGFEKGVAFVLKYTSPSPENCLKGELFNRFVQWSLWIGCQWNRSALARVSPSGTEESAPAPFVEPPPAPPIEITPLTPPWWWKAVQTLFAYPIALVEWIKTKVSLTEDEMEEAEELLEEAVDGITEIVENRERGVVILTRALVKIENLDHKLQNKWFSHSQGNIFLRQKLLKFKMGLSTFVGDRSRVEQTQIVLAELGFSFPTGLYKEWIEKALENTARSARNDTQILLLNGVVSLLKDDTQAEWEKWLSDRLSDEKQLRLYTWASDPEGPVWQTLTPSSKSKMQNLVIEKMFQWAQAHRQDEVPVAQPHRLITLGQQLVTWTLPRAWEALASIGWRLDRRFFHAQSTQEEYQKGLESFFLESMYARCIEGRFADKEGQTPFKWLISRTLESSVATMATLTFRFINRQMDRGNVTLATKVVDRVFGMISRSLKDRGRRDSNPQLLP